MIITKRFSFEASHVLPKHPGKCSRLHGHSWKLAVSVEGPVDERTGFVVDYGVLSTLVKFHIIERLDHKHLGQGDVIHHGRDSASCPPFGYVFYPSSENLCRAIFKLLSPLVQELSDGVTLHEVTIDETCTSSASWSANDERATFDPK